MSSSLVNGMLYLSKLTAALLDDSGFYESVDYSMCKEDISQRLGCDYFYNACLSKTATYDIFCTPAELNKCDYYNLGRSYCYYPTYADGCSLWENYSS